VVGPVGAGATFRAGEEPVRAGQAIYSSAFLRVYDALYGFNHPLLWRCSKQRLVENYEAHLGARHLDVGVGSGALLDACRFPVAAPRITLLDMNPNSLAATAARLARYAPEVRQGNALEPWPVEPGSFDSVSLTHIVHCLPGAIAAKAPAFAEARRALAPGGALFGATILGRGVPLSAGAGLMMAASNRRGVIANREDDPAGLDAVLASTFTRHEIRIRGAVALFTASG
jgi:ubiquinone/menaquinone biosynthesis C-methylase UbiE